ncbi:nucleoid occlusion protein [Tepidibacillus fermentans]|uniref:ParB family chromosome partitioning protein n=1 Tax=Tepidibacillus fermentans TaxID=1281767 RepID=A0A4R3KCL2_9BACI|nr:nucleoid occlusion protein [Tepidibacillus fermentans]TCS80815.1 ParB family chromosome partitioning protein [Tepidibacillus fermentans]
MKDHLSRFFGLAERNQDSQAEEVIYIPVDKIIPSPYQPRTVFADDKLDELCQTIKTHGIIQPIVVRIRNEQYEIIAGERRWRAVKKLGWDKIPAIIKDYNDGQAASIALIENLQREGLTAIEEAVAYKKLIEIHGLTQESLAQRLGKSQSTIANKLRLLNLSPTIQNALMSRQITERHARALLSVHDVETQEKILREILEKELNVKQTENRIKQILEKFTNQEKPKPKRVAFSRDVRLAMNTIRQSVDMVIKTGLLIETNEIDHENYYEFVIKIPKNK